MENNAMLSIIDANTFFFFFFLNVKHLCLRRGLIPETRQEVRGNLSEVSENHLVYSCHWNRCLHWKFSALVTRACTPCPLSCIYMHLNNCFLCTLFTPYT